MALRFTSVSLMQLVRPDIGSASTITSAQLAVVAAQAEAVVLSALADRYTLPDSTSIPLLDGLVTDLAIYRLFSRRMYVTLDAKQRSGIEALYTEATALLAAIATGRVPLVDASGVALAPKGDATLLHSTTMGYTPTWSELPTGDHVLDPDKLDAEAAARDLDPIRDRLV